MKRGGRAMAKKKRLWYYVSFYQEFPVYEPAEGGYYVAENYLMTYRRVGRVSKSRWAPNQ